MNFVSMFSVAAIKPVATNFTWAENMACIGEILYVSENKRGELWKITSPSSGEFAQQQVLGRDSTVLICTA